MQKLILNFASGSLALLIGFSAISVTRASDDAAPTAVPVISIQANQIAAKVSPTLYGLMTEEINFSYEGGLYGELIRNRTFKADPAQPLFWEAVGGSSIAIDATQPLNEALGVSLKVDTSQTSPDHPAGVANRGYWGIPVRSETSYHVSFYAKAAAGFSGSLVAELKSGDGQTVFGSVQIPPLTADWKKYDATLKTENVATTKDSQFALTTTSPGTIWLQQVSLFPPTYHDRANGNRPDLMQILADMKPQFLRFPGGNYLEGDTIDQRFDWKKTLGDVAQRPGHESPWKYWSTDGLGLLEFFEWCEDLQMQPVLAVYDGYSLKQNRVAVGPDLQPYVQDALDEIEYATGDISTTWGARRAKDGHPAPFALTYVEIGNEDFFDHAKTYGARYAQFYDAIKAKYPNLQLISTVNPDWPKKNPDFARAPDVVDEHLYPNSEGQMESRATEFDKRPRTGPKVFVGEWATIIGGPTPNMTAALADAAWMTGLERNSDLVVMECYAPLLANVSNSLKHDPASSTQWSCNLIGYNATDIYGSPSYYAQKMFSTHHGDEVLATDAQDIPTWTWQPPGQGKRGAAAAASSGKQLPSLFFDATRDSQSGRIFLKIVNRSDFDQPVKVVINGVQSVSGQGQMQVLQGKSGSDTNTIQNRTNIVPVSQAVDGLGANFTRSFPPYSISVLEIDTK